LPEI